MEKKFYRTQVRYLQQNTNKLSPTELCPRNFCAFLTSPKFQNWKCEVVSFYRVKSKSCHLLLLWIWKGSHLFHQSFIFPAHACSSRVLWGEMVLQPLAVSSRDDFQPRSHSSGIPIGHSFSYPPGYNIKVEGCSKKGPLSETKDNDKTTDHPFYCIFCI